MKFALIAFLLCQAYPALSQQQGVTPPANQPFVPGGWFRPLYSAAAEAWRDYLIRAQQATNQFYQQWANMTGISNPGGGFGGFGGFGGLGGLYGGNGQQQQPGSTPRPLQGIFNPANIPTGLDLSELLPTSEKPGRQVSGAQAPLQDTPQQTTSRPLQQVQPVQPQLAPPVQQQPPSAVQQPPSSQQQQQQAPAPVQQSPSVQQLQQQPPNPQIQSRPLQTLGQAANTVGLFGGSNPIPWMG